MISTDGAHNSAASNFSLVRAAGTTAVKFVSGNLKPSDLDLSVAAYALTFLIFDLVSFSSFLMSVFAPIESVMKAILLYVWAPLAR